MKHQTTDQTLPSVAPSGGQGLRREVLRLTIVFHADTARIGQVADVPLQSGNAPWVLGRSSPEFSAPGGAPAPLADPYISRRALQLQRGRDGVLLRRPPGSSRCRLEQGELHGDVALDNAALRRGVALCLSHSVVLLLRLGSPPPQHGVDAPSTRHLLGGSAVMAELRAQVASAGASQLDVLICGETGSGKELVARAIHASSARCGQPLLSVNMAAIPQELAGAALFGSARGAFTGADKATPGYFRQAAGGSLFLDEIGATAAAIQPQLLRALQEREIQAVGGAIERVDVRVLAATDAALDAPESTFSAALRFRLAACEIRVPPLREHREDIGALLLHFLRAQAQQHSTAVTLPAPGMGQKAVAAWAGVFFLYACYSWPGNVRELRNFARQLLLGPDTLPRPGRQLTQAVAAEVAGSDPGGASPARRHMRDIADDEFDRVMREQAYELKRVARALGVSRASVYRRIEGAAKYRLANELSPQELRRALDAAGDNIDRAALALGVSGTALRARLRDHSPS